MTGSADADADAVLAANREFYDAFEARDTDAMAKVWVRDQRASVTHPGWETLRGWAKVIGSWDAIFANTGSITLVLTDAHVEVGAELAVVTLDEHLLQAHGRGDPAEAETSGARVAATNVFLRTTEGWRILQHHGSPVAQ